MSCKRTEYSNMDMLTLFSFRLTDFILLTSTFWGQLRTWFRPTYYDNTSHIIQCEWFQVGSDQGLKKMVNFPGRQFHFLLTFHYYLSEKSTFSSKWQNFPKRRALLFHAHNVHFTWCFIKSHAQSQSCRAYMHRYTHKTTVRSNLSRYQFEIVQTVLHTVLQSHLMITILPFYIRRATSVLLGKGTKFALHHGKMSTTKCRAIQMLHISTFRFTFKCGYNDFISKIHRH